MRTHSLHRTISGPWSEMVCVLAKACCLLPTTGVTPGQLGSAALRCRSAGPRQSGSNTQSLGYGVGQERPKCGSTPTLSLRRTSRPSAALSSYWAHSQGQPEPTCGKFRTPRIGRSWSPSSSRATKRRRSSTTEHSFLGIGTSHLPSSQAESVTMCEVRSVTYVSGRSNSLTIQAQTDSSRFSLRSRRRRPLNDYPERSARA